MFVSPPARLGLVTLWRWTAVRVGGLPLQVWKGRKRRVTALPGRDRRVLGFLSASPSNSSPSNPC